MTGFRPWGHIDWLIGRLTDRQWSLLACCGTEERSIALPTYLGRGQFAAVEVVAVRDPQPLNRQHTHSRLVCRRKSLLDSGFHAEEIIDAELLGGLERTLEPVGRLAEKGAASVIIDITSLPKLWFFPIVQAALRESCFKDIIVTYTSAKNYSDELSANIGPVQTLPGFFAEDARKKHDVIIVGIGFEPLNLVQLLKDQESENLRLIFPFPAGPSGQKRNWLFVREIEELTEREHLGPEDRVHISMHDCPQLFGALCDITDGGQRKAAIAPYGPKTVSLAMCLFAIAVNAAGGPRVPVLYSQPYRYALDYSVGVGMKGGAPNTVGYCLRLGGRDLYALA